MDCIEFKTLCGKHEFRVICNKDKIMKEIISSKEDFEEGYYQSYYTIGYEEGYLSKEEYIENIDYMISRLNFLTDTETMKNLIDKAKKKKNGTFYKNKIVDRIACNNTVFITEWHNTWIYKALTVKAISDTTLSITYDKVTDTPA